MRAAVLNGYGELLSIADIPRPVPAVGEVLIKVTAAGLCHTDLHLIDGDPAILPGFPAILGHETAGIVEELGAGVTTVSVGDAVAVFGTSLALAGALGITRAAVTRTPSSRRTGAIVLRARCARTR
jgi:D-arabinose 1-dehydrogenase-like Zn-dependent alcohol dehydrogenase